MDRNQGIGMVLIAALVLAYIFWFAPKPEKTLPPTLQQETTSTNDSLASASQTPIEPDSTEMQAFGQLGENLTGTEADTHIETKDLKITFNNKGGVIKALELKNYKTYHQKPLMLIEPGRNDFQLMATYQGKDIDLLSKPFYEVQQTKKGDTTILSFATAGGKFIQRYAIPDEGYEIGYSLENHGLAADLNGDKLKFSWTQRIAPTEKDIKDTRKNTAINYYLPNDGFDDFTVNSGVDTEVMNEGPLWISMKQKYFLSAIIAEQPFASGEVVMGIGNDTTIVKTTNVKLDIKKEDFASGKTNYKLYLGPNDYQIIGDVAPSFAKNVYLGWPPVYWVNKFVIFPVFHFLTLHIANYGLIIIILVLLLKAVLAPLSYRSYLSMAKMKVLKPELDEIKEKNGDDAAAAQQEQLKLYQQVGVNPISGCIPVVLQMPILFAMFYLFPASIELRQESFLWAEDLSTYDSLITIPIGFLDNHLSLFTVLMTATTLVYTWQNNQLSSVQGPMKSMSYIMPLVFFFVLNSFSAGLTFYYFVSTLVTFIQQAVIKRFVNEDKIKAILEENRKRIKSGSGKKSKFMTKLEEAMKNSQEARKSSETKKKK